MSACAVRTPAESGRSVVDPADVMPIPDEAWPSRVSDRIKSGPRRRIGNMILQAKFEPSFTLPDGRRLDMTEEGRFGEGYVYRFEGIDGVPRRPTGRDSYMFVTVNDATEVPDRPSELGDFMVFGQLWPRLTDFRVSLPTGEPRGLIVHLSSLNRHSRYERAVTEAFRLRGWAVLATSLPFYYQGEATTPLDVERGPEDVGRRLARRIDDWIAEWVYGVEAMLEFMAAEYPDLAMDPIVGFGCSAGAMALPAVAARLPDTIDAAVLVGGGANVLAISRSTILGAIGLDLEWKDDREPTRDEWALIEHSYRSNINLDPLHAARFLRPNPALMLHALHDSIVPVASGDRLHVQLGRPERWAFRTGHIGLFLLLPTQATRIVEWVEQAIEDDA